MESVILVWTSNHCSYENAEAKAAAISAARSEQLLHGVTGRGFILCTVLDHTPTQHGHGKRSREIELDRITSIIKPTR
ncbi:hypothetical protein Leryth_004269 [Lithospermum erythrorhizon]|nr:hypothetical protein Leryth_004269 [Lithospermum erythrorhizon]